VVAQGLYTASGPVLSLVGSDATTITVPPQSVSVEDCTAGPFTEDPVTEVRTCPALTTTVNQCSFGCLRVLLASASVLTCCCSCCCSVVQLNSSAVGVALYGTTSHLEISLPPPAPVGCAASVQIDIFPRPLIEAVSPTSGCFDAANKRESLPPCSFRAPCFVHAAKVAAWR
jgi:hypothetical protein